MTLFFGMFFFSYFLKLSAGRGFWTNTPLYYIDIDEIEISLFSVKDSICICKDKNRKMYRWRQRLVIYRYNNIINRDQLDI